MLGSLGKLVSRGNDYDTGDFVKDCEANCVCCVVDSQHRDDRCCACTTVDPNGYDIFDCGHANEAEMESPETRQRRQNQRWIRRLLIVGVLVWGAVAVFSIFNPSAVMFNVVVDDEYADHLNEGKHMKESMMEQRLRAEEKKKEEELGANVITNFLNELLRSDKADEKDKTAVMHVLELASEKMASSHCETVVITSPIKVYGSACLFYALMCMIMTFDEAPMRTSATTLHLVWYGCATIGIAIATAGHGRTMESSTFTFVLLTFSGAMTAVWFVMRERITRYISVHVAQLDATKPT